MSVLLSYRNAERRPKCISTHRVPRDQRCRAHKPRRPRKAICCTFHKTRPLRRPLSTPHGYDTRLRAGEALQAAGAGLPCPLPHQSRSLWPGPTKVWSARRSRRGKQSRTEPSCQTCHARSMACVKLRGGNHARPHSGSPRSIRPLLESMCTAEKVLKVHAQPLTLSCLHNNNSPPGCLLQQANAVQSQGPEKYMRDTRQRTGAADANAYSGISRIVLSHFLFSQRDAPNWLLPRAPTGILTLHFRRIPWRG